MVHYTDEEKDDIWNWSLYGSILSYVGFAFIFLTFICISNLRRRLPFRMLMNLAAMGMILTLTGILTTDAEEFNAHHHHLCVCVGFLRNFTANCTILWSLMFAKTMSDYMFKEVRCNVELRNYALAYGIPFILSCIPLFMDIYGEATIYCWIHYSHTMSLSLDFVFFYLPVIAVMTTLFFYYIRMCLRLKSVTLSKEDRKLLLQFFFHPCSMFVSFIFPALNRFYNLPFKEGRILWMMKMHVFCLQSLVLVNALVFGMNKTVWRQIGKVFKSLRCLKSHTNADEPKYYSINSTFVTQSMQGNLAVRKERRDSQYQQLLLTKMI